MGSSFKHCPYCSSHLIRSGHTLFNYYIQCTSCQASGPKNRSLEGAVLHWNELSETVIRATQVQGNDLLTRIMKMENSVHQLEVELNTSQLD
ncbi:MAG: hypothetical protein HRU38_14755 [Saccharospirillaceae bacterium]|nr:hypothetical protein [Pseudomonadales bacterium]NRB79902.1 hypothetical protein [Saccharospirillaceae bacterium]